MASVNKSILVGNLGADPELRYTPGGQAVCDFRIATSETFTTKAGEARTATEWHKVVVWGKQAENCSKYLSKGRQVYVEGKLRTRKWERDGQNHYTTEIVATSVQFLGAAPKKAEAGQQAQGSEVPDDIPLDEQGLEQFLG